MILVVNMLITHYDKKDCPTMPIGMGWAKMKNGEK